MGATSLISKGILSPIEGDVVFHRTELPLNIEAVKTEMSITLPDEIIAESNLPDEVLTDTVIEGLTTEIEIPLLDVKTEIKE